MMCYPLIRLSYSCDFSDHKIRGDEIFDFFPSSSSSRMFFLRIVNGFERKQTTSINTQQLNRLRPNWSADFRLDFDWVVAAELQLEWVTPRRVCVRILRHEINWRTFSAISLTRYYFLFAHVQSSRVCVLKRTSARIEYTNQNDGVRVRVDAAITYKLLIFEFAFLVIVCVRCSEKNEEDWQ